MLVHYSIVAVTQDIPHLLIKLQFTSPPLSIFFHKREAVWDLWDNVIQYGYLRCIRILASLFQIAKYTLIIRVI